MSNVYLKMLCVRRIYVHVSAWAVVPVMVWSFTLMCLHEDNFIKRYGNNVTSGMWESVRNISSDEDKLKNISLRAHAWAHSRLQVAGDEILKASFENWTLMFDDRTLEPIVLETIAYSVPVWPNHTFFICKGLRPDCVHYLWKRDHWEPKPKFLYLGLHVCESYPDDELLVKPESV